MKMSCAVETERVCISVEPPATILSKVLVVGGRSARLEDMNTGTVLDTLWTSMFHS